jgi:hypothetical protein
MYIYGDLTRCVGNVTSRIDHMVKRNLANDSFNLLCEHDSHGH